MHGAIQIVEVALLARASGPEVPARALIGGTPLRGEIELRGTLDAAMAAATARLRAQFGDGEIAAETRALVIDAARFAMHRGGRTTARALSRSLVARWIGRGARPLLPAPSSAAGRS